MIIHFLLSYQPSDWNCSTIENPVEVLWNQSEKGNLTGVKFILNNCHGIDVNAGVPKFLSGEQGAYNRRTYEGRTALFFASLEGHEEVVKFLLQRPDINVNPKLTFDHFDKLSDGHSHGWKGMTPVWRAHMAGFNKIVDLLLDDPRIDVVTGMQKYMFTNGTINGIGYKSMGMLLFKDANKKS